MPIGGGTSSARTIEGTARWHNREMHALLLRHQLTYVITIGLKKCSDGMLTLAHILESTCLALLAIDNKMKMHEQPITREITC